MNKGGFFLFCCFLSAILSAGQVGSSSAASTVKIYQIQGNGFFPARYGQTVITQGVVTADFDDASAKGFSFQDDDCDSNPSTSDGVFVFLDERIDLVSVGDHVEVRGVVDEFFGLTRINVQPSDVLLLSHGHDLPVAMDLQPPFDNEQTRTYFESLEGMLVHVNDARVVGPTDSYGDTWVIRSDLGLERVFHDDVAGTGELICVSPEGLYEIQLAKVGDQILGLYGVLDYSLGLYRVQLLTEPTQIPAQISPPSSREAANSDFTFASLNLDNLFDTVDDPNKEDPVLAPAEYQRKLDKLALTIHDGLGEPTCLLVVK